MNARGWIRTIELERGRIYSPLRLATSLPLRIDASHYPVNSGRGNGKHLPIGLPLERPNRYCRQG